MAWFQKKPAAAGGARPPAPVEKIHELLNERSVVFPAQGDKEALLRATATAACAAHGLGDPAPYIARLLEREEGISTTLDTGLSLPHARIDGLNAIAAALALPRAPVVDPKHPEAPVRAMFLFFSPNRQEAFGRHLQVLRGVSTVLKPELLDQLSKLKTPAQVLALLRERQP